MVARSRRVRALVSVSVVSLALGGLAACNSEGDLAVVPAPVNAKSEKPAASGDHPAMGMHDGHDEGAAPPAAPVQMPLFHDLGSHTHKISTKNAQAQLYFDQGYRYLFNFNHNAAILSFQEALKRDPNCAMCWWGIAFAYGPNINMPMMPEAIQPAFEASQHAQGLAPNAPAAEQAYIAAIAKRYTNSTAVDRATLDRAFADAMKQVMTDYPNDLDAATLYAEALMDTSPWNYWRADRKTPNPGMEDLVPTLEAILKKDPKHPGAEHLYIHAVEASDNPGRAERYADMLEPQMPGAGHLVHMPSHIYNRIGRYNDGVKVNQAAAKSDEAYFANTNDVGLYAGMYYVHNLHFVWTAASSDGRSAVAIDYAHQVVKATQPQFAHAAPPAELFLPTTLYAYLRFGKWDEVLAAAKPDGQFAFATAMWHYAQARASAAKGDVERAISEQALIATSFPKGEADRFAQFDVPGAQLVEIAGHVAQAEIYRAQRKTKDEIGELETAVKLQDALKYMEPPYWDFPVRHFLGAAYLTVGRAKDAEHVYRDDLKEWPKNGWALFGLSQALTREGRAKDAKRTKKDFEQAWSRADVTLTASRF